LKCHYYETSVLVIASAAPTCHCERSANLSLRAQRQPVIASAARQSSPVIAALRSQSQNRKAIVSLPHLSVNWEI
ncbi:MAG: hypothetical protein PHX14_08765, partial [Syntrophomonadaceae bacterium]|nr:hypothetical protein [Syntrophomonadaceae bacterium]